MGEIFEQRLKEVMMQKDVSQAELVARTGLPKGAVSKYVNGKIFPKTAPLLAIAEALGVDPLWLSGIQDQADSDGRVEQCVEMFQRLDERGQKTILALMRSMLEE